VGVNSVALATFALAMFLAMLNNSTCNRSCDAYCKAVHSIASSYSRSCRDAASVSFRFTLAVCLLRRMTLSRTGVRTSMIVEVRAVGVRWDSLLW
jgi:hypothetical protein